MTILLVCGATAASAQNSKPAIPRDAALEAKIEETLSKMTLDEKIGQMLELNLDVLGKMTVENAKVDREKLRSALTQFGSPKAEIEKLLKMKDAEIIDKVGAYPIDIYQGDVKRAWQLNETMLDTLISKYKVGSILNAPGSRAPSLEQWQKWIQIIQKKSMKHIGIPDIYGLDHNHGVTYVQGGTLFPQPINLGASFNTELARIGAEITAYESRAANCPWVYNPVVDLGRDPRWPRIWESFGEDAIVNARMVEAEIKGYQGDDPNHIDKYHVGTSTKHYFAYGAPWTGKDRTPAYLPPQILRRNHPPEQIQRAEIGGVVADLHVRLHIDEQIRSRTRADGGEGVPVNRGDGVLIIGRKDGPEPFRRRAPVPREVIPEAEIERELLRLHSELPRAFVTLRRLVEAEQCQKRTTHPKIQRRIVLPDAFGPAVQLDGFPVAVLPGQKIPALQSAVIVVAHAGPENLLGVGGDHSPVLVLTLR